MKWRNPFKRKPAPEQVLEDELAEAADAIVLSVANKYVERHGGIRKAVAPQWSADQHRHGGRVVKAMPRNLKRMKELSEKTDD